MAFSIREIISAINSKGGLLKPSHYEVVLTKPTILASDKNTNAEELRLFCSNAMLPGYSFQTVPIKMAGYGVAENRPVEGVLGELTLTFMIDAKADVLNFFHQWLYNIQNINASRDMSGQYNKARVYEFHYPDTYQTKMDIHLYNDQGNAIMTHSFGDVYPSSINNTELSWSDGDAFVKLTVNFVYGWWVTDRLAPTVQDPTAADTNGSDGTKDSHVSSVTSSS